MRALHQFVPSLRAGDAVGMHTLRVRSVLRDLGLESEIFAESAQPEVAHEIHPLDEYVRHVHRGERTDNGVMYQMAVGSVIAEMLHAMPERKLVDYHNFTPPQFFAGWDDREAMRTAVGRRQMERLASRIELGLADSSFNEAELQAAGYRRTAVVPILLDLSSFDGEADGRALARLERGKRQGGADLLFVGRLAPNKCQHDLVKVLAAYRRLYDPCARLHLVGGAGPPRYVKAVATLADRVGAGADVEIAGSVPHPVLAAQYRRADVFVCLSEHEGFCIPLLEAMYHGVPVVAFAAGAVSETLGDGGLLLDDKDPAVVAAAVHRVIGDADLRARLVAAGRARLADFDLAHARARLEAAVQSVIDTPSPPVGEAR